MKALWLALLALPGLAWAEAPERAPRPQLRPAFIAAERFTFAAPFTSPRPRPRPGRGNRDALLMTPPGSSGPDLAAAIAIDMAARESTATEITARALAAAPPHEAAPQPSPLAVRRSPRPKARPAFVRIARGTPEICKVASGGAVCGVPTIRGRTVSPVRGRGGCGIERPVKVSAVGGVRLTRDALIGCDAARALDGWVRRHALPTVGRRGGGLERIVVIAGYSCRTRNSQEGARLSEHAKGRAIDIAGFILRDGTRLSVLKDWRNSPHSPLLKRLHRSACGPFGTVLGPDSDRYHRNHFHFDIARHRSGAYCR